MTSDEVIPEPGLALFRYLRATALLGNMYGVNDDATLAGDAIAATVEDARGFKLCQAVACTFGPYPELAAQALEQHLQDDPQDAHAQVIYATLQMRLDNPEWKNTLEGMLATSSDVSVRNAAQQLLSAAQTAEAP